jgi:hypothetical protein
MTESNYETFKQSGVLRFFTNPYVGILGSIASIIGIFIAIYFYFISQHIRELVYFVNPAKAIVFKPEQTSKLKVSFGNKEIQDNVTAAQIAIWNQGTDSIKKENLLSLINIKTNPPVPILEATIRKKSRDVINLILDQSLDKVGKISLTWNILEKGDGFVVQVIYIGDTNVNLSLDGVIEKQDIIKEIKYTGSILSPVEQFNEQKKLIRAQIILFSVLLLIMIVLALIYAKKLTSMKSEYIRRIPPFIKIISYLNIAVIFLIIGIIIYMIFQRVSEPPFGF